MFDLLQLLTYQEPFVETAKLFQITHPVSPNRYGGSSLYDNIRECLPLDYAAFVIAQE